MGSVTNKFITNFVVSIPWHINYICSRYLMINTLSNVTYQFDSAGFRLPIITGYVIVIFNERNLEIRRNGDTLIIDSNIPMTQETFNEFCDGE